VRKFLLLLSVLFVVSCSSSAEEEPAPPPVKYTLTTAANPTAGGTVAPTTGQYTEGATVSITATPAGEYLFSSWTGATGTTATTSVVMNSNKTVTANFVKKKYPLTITVEGEGTVAEKVIKQGVATDYNSGTVVELTATPKDEWVFKEWTGDLTGAENPKEITIDKAKTVTAVFVKKPVAYLDDNGVTIKANSSAEVGDTVDIGSVTYTIVDETTLRQMVNDNKDVTKVVTTLVTDMKELFKDKNKFNQDIGSWDVSKVTDMSYMFYFAAIFNQNIGNWDVSKVTNMSNMFYSASAFNQNIGSWDVSNVTSMQQMFKEATVFNQDLTKWCVTDITTEPTDFNKDSALTQANLPIWGTCPGNSYTIAVTSSSNADYTLSGEDRSGDVSGNDPGLTFKVGDEVTFSVNATGHPFYLKTVAGIGTDNQISGVTNNGTTSGSVVWTPTTAGTYYYQCSVHSGMVGTITIEN